MRECSVCEGITRRGRNYEFETVWSSQLAGRDVVRPYRHT